MSARDWLGTRARRCGRRRGAGADAALFDLDVVLNVTVYLIMAVLALSLALIWGFGGILCFGQSAFFGLGAYTYAIAMINFGESTGPLLLSIVVPSLFAARSAISSSTAASATSISASSR